MGHADFDTNRQQNSDSELQKLSAENDKYI